MLGSPSRKTNNNSSSGSSFLSRHGHSSMSLGRRGESQGSSTSGQPPRQLPGLNIDTALSETARGTMDPDSVVGSIRFVPHVEFSSRLSLNFEPIERKVADSAHLKIGRFNEKSQNKTAVTFKSKVVSRMHAEIWCQDGNWYIKDAKSSSGTFVNHIRLSPPGQESKPTILTDGDSIQFGIDFRGGTEEVYRCVRTKVEVNRIFQRSNDKYNHDAHKKLKSLTMMSPTTPNGADTHSSQIADDRASTYTAECCICLFAIAPSQALFVAPCSHPYHFKCIRPLLMQHFPNFLCCICRKYADLEASVEQESEAWIASQARDKDPRTPTVEREEPRYDRIDGVTERHNAQEPLSPSTAAVQGTNSLTSDLVTNGEAAEPGRVPAAAGAAADASADNGTAPPLVPVRLFADLALERQVTPRNEQGPFLYGV